MRGRSLIIYVLILICLVLYYYYSEIHRVASQGIPEDHSLLSLNASDVEEFTITGSETITLARKGPLWRITSPVEKPADSSETADFLVWVSRVKILRKLETVPPPAELGLDPPSLLLQFRTTKGESFVHIGNLTPTKQYRYARSSAGKGVFLVDAYQASGLNRDMFTFRDKHVFSLAYEDITGISIRRHGLIMEFSKKRDGTWHLEEDQTLKLKNEKISGLVSRLLRTQARAFPDESAISGNPEIIIELFGKDRSEFLKIWLMPHDLESVCVYSDFLGQPAQIHGSLVPGIPYASFEVMDRSLISLDTGKVNRVVLEGKEKRVFTRTGGRWFSGEKRIEDPSALDSFLMTVNSLEYVDEYMMLPEDVRLFRSIRVSCQESSSSVFDIGLYSKYYVALGDTYYRINEGGMKIINDSFDMLMKINQE